MILQIPHVLSAAQLARCAEGLAEADWRDGRITAGPASARVKGNEQVAETCEQGRMLGRMVTAALESHPEFIAAALPLRVFPPLFNRYAPGMAFGAHVDNAIRAVPGTPHRIRTDLSATIFLSDAASYEGGELHIGGDDGSAGIKLDAGDMVLYPASTIHDVTQVTRGCRVAAFFWIQSMVRDDAARDILQSLDRAIRDLAPRLPDDPALLALNACYHNLVRRWAEL